MGNPFFPVFIDISDKKILVVGAGQIAVRRIQTLLRFGADVTVIAPEAREEIREFAEKERICWITKEFCDNDITEAPENHWYMVLAATDKPEVNEQIVRVCRKKAILSNRSDKKEDCDFYFPSVTEVEGVVIGMNSGGTDPGRVKAVRQKIEKTFSVPSSVMEEKTCYTRKKYQNNLEDVSNGK